MSRLYAWINSDTRKTVLTTRADKQIKLRVNYGSRSDSKHALTVTVDYLNNESKPQISIDKGV